MTTTGGNSNSLFPSSDKDSYPFDEFFIELNGYNKSGNVFYRIGFDYLSDIFAVLTNSDTSESFEVNKAITFPSMVNITLNDLWSIEMQLEQQRAKKGFEVTNNGKSSFTSLLSEKYWSKECEYDHEILKFLSGHFNFLLPNLTENLEFSVSNGHKLFWFLPLSECETDIPKLLGVSNSDGSKKLTAKHPNKKKLQRES